MIALLLVSVQGCDLFQTRDPEPPSQGTSGNQPATDHGIVMSNLRTAIFENNVENYLRCFSDTSVRTYLFVPSPEEQIKFSQWDLDAERRYFVAMGSALRPGAAMSLSDSIITRSVSAGTAIYSLHYTLFVPHQEAGVPRLVQGNMDLYFAEDSRVHLWSIYKWVDTKTTSDSTWSYLRAWFNR